MGILSFQTGQKAIRENITNHVISTNLLKMAEFERWIEDHILMLEAVAQTPFFTDTFPGLITDHENGNEEHRKSHALINGQLSPILHTGGLLELFILRASDGLTLVSTDPKQDGKYLDGQPYFIHGKEDTYVQNVYFSMSIQQTAMTVSTPLKDKSGGNHRGAGRPPGSFRSFRHHGKAHRFEPDRWIPIWSTSSIFLSPNPGSGKDSP